ncbi:RES domain-containing protein [Pedobacter sp. Leaf170]|uniref:RES domain-containing protein n=1 Tax=Pedobacter sp. Leaf170 TaxID=2876558 RepID=UPI001E58C0A3|nr:RES domain-containing protein [Pedobacter sp. Leaf170]
MIEEIFPPYLHNPEQVQAAFDLLDARCSDEDVKQLYFAFEKYLGIKPKDGYPITRAFTTGQFVRARLNDGNFLAAKSVNEIGVNLNKISQGRANPDSIPIFYSANRRLTAMREILQHQQSGVYEMTIGIWFNPVELCMVNLVDNSDEDFKDLSFVHSNPNLYVKDWPDGPRQSAILLNDYFRKKMKAKQAPGLFNITNVLSVICYSLHDVDGIGYGAVSDSFRGYNMAIKNYQRLTCKEVERWKIQKFDDDNYSEQLLCTGKISAEGTITW